MLIFKQQRFNVLFDVTIVIMCVPLVPQAPSLKHTELNYRNPYFTETVATNVTKNQTVSKDVLGRADLCGIVRNLRNQSDHSHGVSFAQNQE